MAATESRFNFTTTARHSYTDDSIEESAFHIPPALAESKQWITFRLESQCDCGGPCDCKEQKKPCSTEVTDGKYGPFVKYSGVRSPENFTDYMSAIEFVKETNLRDDVKGLDGVGFVFTKDDDFVGIDLDGCVDSDNRVKQFANKILGSVDSFAELSPSQEGIHVIAKGSLDDSYQNRNDSLGIEMYEAGRFFTVTGAHIRGTNKRVTDCTGDVRAVQREFMDEEDDWDSASFDASDDGSADVTDASVVKTAKHYSDKFERLYNGGGNSDTSRADLAFCRQLAFWTDENKSQMERIWKNSGRARKKLERDDYVERTIAKAINSNNDTFSGNYK